MLLMNTLIETAFGVGSNLTCWQMVARAATIFFLALVLIRAAGRRSFGLHSTFDSCTTVLLGAILSRAVVGASPFWPTVAAGAALAALHRAIALASIRWPRFNKLVNGESRELVRASAVDQHAMLKGLITSKDLAEAMRQQIGTEDVSKVHRAVLERDGKITVIAK